MPKRVKIDGVGYVSFPDEMDDASITQAIEKDILSTSAVASRRGAAIPKPDGTGRDGRAILGEAVTNTLSDIPSFFGDAAKRVGQNVAGLAQMVRHPIDTAGAMIAEKADHFANAADPSQPFSTQLAEGLRTLPFSGMVEQAGRQVVGTLSGDRQQAADLLGDVATGALTDGIGRVPATARATGTRMRQAAPAKYLEAVNPKNPAAVAPKVPRMMSEGLGPSPDAIAGLEKRLAVANDVLTAAEDAAAGQRFAASDIIRDIAGEVRNLRTPDGNALTGPAATAAQRLYGQLMDAVRKSSRDNQVTHRDLVKIRDDWDVKARSGGAFSKDGYQLDPAAVGRVYDSAAAKLRDRINSAPDVAAANAEMNYLLDARDTLAGVAQGGGQPLWARWSKSDSYTKPIVNDVVDRAAGPRGQAFRARAMETVGKMLGGDPAPAPARKPPQPTGFDIVEQPIPQRTPRFTSDAERLAFEQGAQDAWATLMAQRPTIPPLAHARGAGTVIPGPMNETGFAAYKPGGIDPDFAQVRPSPNLRSSAEDGAYLGGQIDSWEGMAAERAALVVRRRAELIGQLQANGYSAAQALHTADLIMGMEGL